MTINLSFHLLLVWNAKKCPISDKYLWILTDGGSKLRWKYIWRPHLTTCVSTTLICKPLKNDLGYTRRLPVKQNSAVSVPNSVQMYTNNECSNSCLMTWFNYLTVNFAGIPKFIESHKNATWKLEPAILHMCNRQDDDNCDDKISK